MATALDTNQLAKIATLVRSHILKSTTRAGSGHPTSALSATDLMVALMFGGTFRYDADDPRHPNNDRLIFSKGHASPLLYALWAAAGRVSDEEMLTYREFGSRLEGHPTPNFPYAEAATGSLGQGLPIGVGMALNAKYLDRLPYRTYVLLGDSEMAEGSQWEAMQLAAEYELDNLVGVIDVNRLGQRGETMYGWDLEAYQRRVSSFGWHTITIDGHDLTQTTAAFEQAAHHTGSPVMIIAKTIKGKGVSFLEDAEGKHGKPVSEDDFERALDDLGPIEDDLVAEIASPDDIQPLQQEADSSGSFDYELGKKIATRDAYGSALNRIAPAFPDLVVLDGEVSNSTRAETYKEDHPESFFEMYIAEQAMLGAALGLAKRGKRPFVSTFAAFLTRAFDQIRMARYSDANMVICGSHAGVSIGEDGPSQMGLEDVAMFRAVVDSTVLYPCDAVSCERLVEAAAETPGIVYLRTTRGATPVIYAAGERFPVGGCKVLRQSDSDQATLIAAGITLHEALAAHEQLAQDGIAVRVIDLYSIKPLDIDTLTAAAQATGRVITIEDHYEQGGLGEAVTAALSTSTTPVYRMAVDKKPRSGKPQELLDFEGLTAEHIVQKVRSLVGS